MAMLQQECGWFDHKNHSSALSARLTGDVGSLQRVCTICILHRYEILQHFNLERYFPGHWFSHRHRFAVDFHFSDQHHHFDELFGEISTYLSHSITSIIHIYHNWKQVSVRRNIFDKMNYWGLILFPMRCRRMSKMTLIEKELLENGMKNAAEAVTNIRTVASLSMSNYNYIVTLN